MNKATKSILFAAAISLTTFSLAACKPETHAHTLEYVPANEATCTQDGNSAYWHCSGCGKNFSDEAATHELDEGAWIIEATGHTFSEDWSYDADYHWHAALCGHGDLVSDRGEHTFVDGVCTVCNYSLEKFTVSFETYGGSEVQSIFSYIIETSPATTKEGYTFLGWFTDKALENKVTFPFAVTQNITLYAGWEKDAPLEFTVTFETYGGTDVGDVTTSLIETSPATTKEGYTFLGWFTDKALENKVTFPFAVTQNITLYAGWEKIILQHEFVIDEDGLITAVNNITAQNSKITIPSTVNGKTVTGIDSYLFRNNTVITSLTIPENLTFIGVGVCMWCTNLTEVILPSDLKSVSSDMFCGCINLKNIDLPQSLSSIGADSFSRTAITSMILPDSVKYIGNYAFKDCAALAKIDLNKVEEMGGGVFQNCTSLSSVEFPDTLRKLDGTYMFMNCSALVKVTLPQNALRIAYTFLDYTALYNDPANWKDGVLYVDNYLICVNSAFDQTSQYTVEPSTITIANNAFNSMAYTGKLTKIVLPDGLKTIGSGAFRYCSALEKINIPSTVTTIGSDAFDGTAIKSDYIDNWLVRYSGSLSSTLTIADGTIGIADGEIFGSNSTVTQIILPSSLCYIGESNFESFYALTAVTLPENLLRIGDSAFNFDKALTNINTEDCKRLEYIGETAFSWCQKVGSFYISESVNFIGESAFNQCKAVINIQAASLPATWDTSWDSTYGDPLEIKWGAQF